MITVTKPLLPEIDSLIPYLKDIWNSKWITNNGKYKRLLENKLSEYLEVPRFSLFTNGTIPLMIAIKALNLKGEIITTPYTFVATSHSIIWNNCTPVFVDVDPIYGNIDPDLIEKAVTDKTCAILAVHVYGNPCEVSKIQGVADKYNLKTIYDAAHSFGVKVDNTSILKYGDISTLSFHATKVYNTLEGGGLVCNNLELFEKIENLIDFGIVDENSIVDFGLNGKIDEVRAAYGILNLEKVQESIENRKKIFDIYRERFLHVGGLRFLDDIEGVTHNYSYFPIFVEQKYFGMSRDDLQLKLKASGVLARKYFYPLVSNMECYKKMNFKCVPENLPVSNKLANDVLCLPVYGDLSIEDAIYIADRVLDSRL